MPYIDLDPTLAEPAPTLTVGAPKTSTGKTLDGMSLELLLRLGGRADIDPARAKVWINDAYKDYCSSLDLPELKSTFAFDTVVGQYLYGCPPQVDYTTGAAIADTSTYPFQGGQPLDKIDIESFQRKPDWQDDVQSFFKYNDDLIVVWPKPSTVHSIVVNFQVRPLDLVEDTDSPFIATEHHEGILLLSVNKAFEALLEWENSQLAMNAYVAWVRRRKDRGAAEKSGMIARARGVRGNADIRRPRYNRGDY